MQMRAEEVKLSEPIVGRLGTSLHLAFREHGCTSRLTRMLAELRTVRLRKTNFGDFRIDHDSGKHDDQAMAIGLAVVNLSPPSRRSGPVLYTEEEIRLEDFNVALEQARSNGLLPKPAALGHRFSGDFAMPESITTFREEDQSQNGKTAASPFGHSAARDEDDPLRPARPLTVRLGERKPNIMSTCIETGQRFGRWTVLGRAANTRDGDPRWWWYCRCACGTERAVRGTNLRRGVTRSCGCLDRELTGARSLTHGLSRPGQEHPLYATWMTMKQRCSNPNRRSGPTTAAAASRSVTAGAALTGSPTSSRTWARSPHRSTPSTASTTTGRTHLELSMGYPPRAGPQPPAAPEETPGRREPPCRMTPSLRTAALAITTQGAFIPAAVCAAIRHPLQRDLLAARRDRADVDPEIVAAIEMIDASGPGGRTKRFQTFHKTFQTWTLHVATWSSGPR